MTKTKIEKNNNNNKLKEDIKQGLLSKFKDNAAHYPHIYDVCKETAEEDAQIVIDVLKKWIYKINKDVVTCEVCDNYILKELKKELLK